MNALTLAEIASIALGAPGIAYGSISQEESLDEIRGAKKQQGFDTGVRRVGAFHVFLSNDKKGVRVSHEDLHEAIDQAFTRLGVKLPVVLAERPAVSPRPDELVGRATLRVISASCYRCSSETPEGNTRGKTAQPPSKPATWTPGPTVHVRLGRCIAPVQLILCAKCAHSESKTKNQ